MIFTTRLSMLQFFSRTTFRKEITLVLILKILALCLLWGICFWRPGSGQLSHNELSQRFAERDVK